MKIIVDSMPNKPEDCLFSKLNYFSVNNEKQVFECPLKSNKFPESHEHALDPKYICCSLMYGENCSHLTTIGAYNHSLIEGPSVPNYEDDLEDIIRKMI